ncbi:Lipase_3 domain-containing protein [Psidium guajava]|nr:Lipase_3 domain-containing protein [Psidium guajava]
MGKNIVTLNQASLKISKHQKRHQQQQQQFNSLIKVLRPRVYITDTSCFKKLVQELTGNGTSEHDDDHLLVRRESLKKAITVPQIEDHRRRRRRHQGDDSSNRYLSNHTSSPLSSSDGVSNRQVLDETYFFEEELMTLEHSTSNSNPMFDSLSTSAGSVHSKSPSFSCEDLESWLLDMEMLPAAPFCNGLAQLEPEVSIYDYELSGLL